MLAAGPIGQPANQTVASMYTSAAMSDFYNDTAAITTAERAGITLSFEGGLAMWRHQRDVSLTAGSGAYVYGMSGPDGGEAEVKLDGVVVDRLNLTVRMTVSK